MNYPLLYFIALLLCLPNTASGQKVIYNFERLSTQDGLPSNTIYDIIQDKQGFLWFGTDKGLCRYDGYRVKVFVHDTNNPKSISSNMIKRIYEGKDGKIWIASLQTGLSCYDPSLPDQEAFTNYPGNLKDTSGLRNNEIFDVYEDLHGYIWVAGLDTDLQRLNPGTGKFETISLGEKRIGHNSYFRFMPDQENKFLWLGSRHDGFFRFNPLTKEVTQFNYQHLSKGLENGVGAFAFTENKVWVSYYNLGVSYLDLKTNSFTTDVFGIGRNVNFYDNTFFTLAVAPDKIIWSGHNRNGIYLFNPETNESQHLDWNELTPGDALPSHVEVIFFDQNNIGWIGTSGKGLLKYDPYHNQFNQFNAFSETAVYGNVLQLIQDKNHIWFHAENGVGKYNAVLKQTELFFPYKKEGIDVSQINFIDGTLFISSTNKGVWYVDEKRKQLKSLSITGETEDLDRADVNTVLGGYQNGDSVLWIGSWRGGLYRYNKKTKTVHRFTSQDGLPDNKVIQLGYDPKGCLWISTQSHGIARLRDKQEIKFELFMNDPLDPESLPANTVHCFYTDRQNRFWLGTNLGGIVEVLEQDTLLRFHYFKDDNKLAYEGLHTIVQNKEGDLLMYTENGIAIFKPSTSRINHQYEKTSLYPSAYPITALASHSSYDILLGTKNGFLNSTQNTALPVTIKSTAISGFRIFDHDYSHLLHKDKIVLPYFQNFFTIEFTVPQYSETKNITFAYKLIGVDKEWRYTNRDRSATYTDVGGGDYTFEVKASNAQGAWSEPSATLLISVTPPFWATYWFRIIAVLLIVVTVYFIHRYRVHQLLVIQRIRNNIAKDLHDDVGATLSSIRILSEVANQKLNEDQPEYAGHLMAKVSIQAAEMADNMSDIIWTFNPYNDHLEKMIQRLQLQFHDLCEAKGIRLQTAIGESVASVSLSLEVRKSIYMICKEAIHNAVKYADGDRIELTVQGTSRAMTITIRDNGKGFVRNDSGSEGNGIRNMSLRAEEIKAAFRISSNAEGTYIEINFNPMSNGHTYFNL